MSTQRELEMDHKHDLEAIEQPQSSDADVMEEKLAHLDAQLEREKTVSQALKSSKRLMPYFIYGIWTIVCCSFDNSAGIVVLGIPAFRRDFGYAFNGNYILPADWQSAFSGGPAAAQILATFFAGYVGDKIGRKKMCWIAYFILMVGITLEFISSETAHPRELFFTGKFINGLGIGILLTTGYTYVAEIAPVMLRGIFIAAASEAFCIGTFTLALIVNAYGSRTDAWAYRSAFVTQYFVTGFGVLFLPFIPESPMWLVSKGKTDLAIKSQRRLGATEEEASRRIANHSYTLKKAAQESAGATYAELFKGSNRRRTMVASVPMTFQSFSGVVWVIGYFVYYAQLAGYSTEMSFKLNITQQVLSLTGNMCSWFVIERLGRRFLTLMGIFGLTALLLAAGIAATVGGLYGNRATISFVLCTCFYWNFTLGATSKVAMAEIGTSRLRNKTAGFGVAMQGTLATFWNFVLPYMFNPNAGNLQGKCAFVFGGTSLICCVYTYFCHPETKGRTFEEMDEMFMKKVPARQFRAYVTEAEMRSREVKEEVQAKGQAGDEETV